MRDRRGRRVAVSMGKATKTCPSRRVRRCAHVVLRTTVVRLKLACLWEKSQKCVFLGVSEDDRRCAHTFFAEGEAPCDIRQCFRRNVCAHDRRETKVAASMVKVT